MGCGASSGNEIEKPDKLQPTSTLSSQGPRYLRKQIIGQGTYGSVYRCIQFETNKEYAMKVIKINAKTLTEAKRQIQLLKNEISTLKKLSHPNIVKYYSFDITPDLQEVEIVLELVKNGTLKTFIEKNGALNESITAELCGKILEALSYLHQMKIIHRDLKCANVLITQDLEPKLTDFGTAKMIIDKDNDDIAKLSASLKGTPYYMAPEVLKRVGHNQSADIWSFGCMAIEMISGKAPWAGLNSKFSQIINYISSGVHPPFPPHITKQCAFFLQSCLDPIPTKRLKAPQLLKHRFIERIHKNSRRDSNNFETKKSMSRNTIVNDISQIDLQIQQMDLNKQTTDFRSPIKTKKGSLAYIDTELKSQRNQNITRRQKSFKKYSTNKKEHYHQPNKKYTEKYQRQIQKLEKLQDQISEVSISQEQFPKDYYVVKKALTNLKRKKGKNITKTSTTMKNTEDNLLLNLSASQMVGSSNNDIQLRSNTEMTHEQLFINTSISKAERDQYIQQQKILQRQRDDEKRKWEEQLKEGAQMLKKQFSNRYMFPNR